MPHDIHPWGEEEVGVLPLRLVIHVGTSRRIPTGAFLRRNTVVVVVAVVVVLLLRETALSSEARAKPCLRPQARLSRKAIFGTESVEQTRTEIARRRLAWTYISRGRPNDDFSARPSRGQMT